MGNEAVYMDLGEWLEKAAHHKYLKRLPTGKAKPKWRYIYGYTSKHHHRSKAAVGEKVQVDHNGQRGHYEVTDVHGDGHATLKHDETGHEIKVKHSELHDMFDAHHKEGIKDAHEKLKDTHKRAFKHGTQRQVNAAKEKLDAHKQRFEISEPAPKKPDDVVARTFEPGDEKRGMGEPMRRLLNRLADEGKWDKLAKVAKETLKNVNDPSDVAAIKRLLARKPATEREQIAAYDADVKKQPKAKERADRNPVAAMLAEARKLNKDTDADTLRGMIKRLQEAREVEKDYETKRKLSSQTSRLYDRLSTINKKAEAQRQREYGKVQAGIGKNLDAATKAMKSAQFALGRGELKAVERYIATIQSEAMAARRAGAWAVRTDQFFKGAKLLQQKLDVAKEKAAGEKAEKQKQRASQKAPPTGSWKPGTDPNSVAGQLDALPEGATLMWLDPTGYHDTTLTKRGKTWQDASGTKETAKQISQEFADRAEMGDFTVDVKSAGKEPGWDDFKGADLAVQPGEGIAPSRNANVRTAQRMQTEAAGMVADMKEWEGKGTANGYEEAAINAQAAATEYHKLKRFATDRGMPNMAARAASEAAAMERKHDALNKQADKASDAAKAEPEVFQPKSRDEAQAVLAGITSNELAGFPQSTINTAMTMSPEVLKLLKRRLTRERKALRKNQSNPGLSNRLFEVEAAQGLQSDKLRPGSALRKRVDALKDKLGWKNVAESGDDAPYFIAEEKAIAAGKREPPKPKAEDKPKAAAPAGDGGKAATKATSKPKKFEPETVRSRLRQASVAHEIVTEDKKRKGPATPRAVSSMREALSQLEEMSSEGLSPQLRTNLLGMKDKLKDAIAGQEKQMKDWREDALGKVQGMVRKPGSGPRWPAKTSKGMTHHGTAGGSAWVSNGHVMVKKDGLTASHQKMADGGKTRDIAEDQISGLASPHKSPVELKFTGAVTHAGNGDVGGIYTDGEGNHTTINMKYNPPATVYADSQSRDKGEYLSPMHDSRSDPSYVVMPLRLPREEAAAEMAAGAPEAVAAAEAGQAKAKATRAKTKQQIAEGRIGNLHRKAVWSDRALESSDGQWVSNGHFAVRKDKLPDEHAKEIQGHVDAGHGGKPDIDQVLPVHQNPTAYKRSRTVKEWGAHKNVHVYRNDAGETIAVQGAYQPPATLYGEPGGHEHLGPLTDAPGKAETSYLVMPLRHNKGDFDETAEKSLASWLEEGEPMAKAKKKKNGHGEQLELFKGHATVSRKGSAAMTQSLEEYLEKSGTYAGLPSGEPKMGHSKSATVEGGSADGGELGGVGTTSGEGSGPSGPGQDGGTGQVKAKGLTKGKKFSEDDEDDEGQMKAHKKPIETIRKGEGLPMTPGNQREQVAYENAQASRELQKSRDLVYGAGTVPVSPYQPHGELRKSVREWNQGPESAVQYSDASDVQISELQSNGDPLNVTPPPSLGPPSALINQETLCKSDGCGTSYGSFLTCCPGCGNGAVTHRTLPSAHAHVVEEAGRNPVLRAPRATPDHVYPSGIPMDD